MLETRKVGLFQLRLKKYSFKQKILIGKKIQQICKKNSVKFIVNDDPILSKKLNADGCHLGQNDLNILGKGRVRDAVLQIRYISADGEIITCGAPVVKNVSGFSLHKLMVGSLGTLGVIAETTLRTNPIPDVSTWITASSKNPQIIFNALYKPCTWIICA